MVLRPVATLRTSSRPGWEGVRGGLLLLALLGLAACAAGPGQNPFAEAAADRIRIRAENRNFNQVTLYAVTSTRRIRMGTVVGSGQESFVIDWDTSRDLAVDIDVLGGPTFRTPPIRTRPGESVILVIESDIRNSRLR